MARRKYSPYGPTRKAFAYDTRIGEFVSRRTGEIVSASDALLLPERTRQTFPHGRPGAYAVKYEPPQRLHGDQALDLIRRQAQRQIDRKNPEAYIVIRGKGGTEEYPRDAWSTPGIRASTIQRMDDDRLSDWCFGIQDDGPRELDIYIVEEGE